MKRIIVVGTMTLWVLAACGTTGEERSDPASNRDSSSTTEAETTTTSESTTTTTEPPPEAADARASGYLGGNVSPAFGPGEPGELTVVAVGAVPPDATFGVSVPVVVRNGTRDPLYDIEATGRATDAGSLVGSGTSQGFQPAVIEPGEIAIGFVFFGSEVPASAEVEVTATGQDELSDIFASVPMTMGEANLVEGEFSQQIVGEVATSEEAAMFVGVLVMCFDEAGTPIGTSTGSVDGDDVAEGASGSYSVDLFDQPCPGFLVGASGPAE